MRQSIFPEGPFDKAGFSDYILKIKGDSSIVELSRNCGVSTSFISKYLNQSAEKPPTLDTLLRISAYTSSLGVSFEDLGCACGYSPKDIQQKSFSGAKIRAKAPLFKTVISNALLQVNFTWSFLPDSYSAESFPENHFSIAINSDELSEWHFEFRGSSTPNDNSYSPPMFWGHLYGRMATSNYKKNSKVSIVTDSKFMFDLLTKHDPKMLALYVSIILVDIKTMSIIEEKYVETALELNDSVLKYSLK